MLWVWTNGWLKIERGREGFDCEIAVHGRTRGREKETKKGDEIRKSVILITQLWVLVVGEMILYCKLQDDAAWVWWVRLREVVLEDRECDNLASDTVDDSPRILPRILEIIHALHIKR